MDILREGLSTMVQVAEVEGEGQDRAAAPLLPTLAKHEGHVLERLKACLDRLDH